MAAKHSEPISQPIIQGDRSEGSPRFEPRSVKERAVGREDCQPAQPGAGWWVGAPATTPTEELYVQLCPDRLWALVPSRILAHVHYVSLSKYLRFTLTAPEVAGGPLRRGKP